MNGSVLENRVHAEWLEPTDHGWLVHLLIRSRAAHTAIVGVHEGRLVMTVAVPPIEGRSNLMISKTIAARLNQAVDEVTLVSGLKSKKKTVRVAERWTRQVMIQRLEPSV